MYCGFEGKPLALSSLRPFESRTGTVLSSLSQQHVGGKAQRSGDGPEA